MMALWIVSALPRDDTMYAVAACGEEATTEESRCAHASVPVLHAWETQ